MPFTEDELSAFRLLMREELRAFEPRLDRRFDQVLAHIDGLYQRDESREQEYLSMREQLRRLERRVDSVEKKVA